MYTFFKWLGAFVDLHWGDLCGMFLIVYGARIISYAHGDASSSALGESLLLAGATILRPKPGNGNILQMLKGGKTDEKNPSSAH
jgi:hypothetical protein